MLRMIFKLVPFVAEVDTNWPFRRNEELNPAGEKRCESKKLISFQGNTFTFESINVYFQDKRLNKYTRNALFS